MQHDLLVFGYCHRLAGVLRCDGFLHSVAGNSVGHPRHSTYTIPFLHSIFRQFYALQLMPLGRGQASVRMLRSHCVRKKTKARELQRGGGQGGGESSGAVATGYSPKLAPSCQHYDNKVYLNDGV